MDDLKAAHAELLRALDDLEAAVAGEVPDRATLLSARWKLSRASRACRKLLSESVYPRFARGDPRSAKVALLRDKDREMSVRSAAHVAKWTPEAVLADFAGYRAASAAMRRDMRARIAEEGAILYPLLQAEA